MSLETERILLESKISGLKRERESKKMEGEMFVQQVRNELSPYLDFDEMDINRAKLAFDNIARLSSELKALDREIRKQESKL